MKTEIKPFNNLYAQGVQLNDAVLNWDAGGQEFLVLRAPINQSIALDERVVAALNAVPASDFLSGRECGIGEGLYAQYVKSPSAWYKIPVRPATYAVFAISHVDADAADCDLTVYRPNEAMVYQCKVPLLISASVDTVVQPQRKKGLFGRLLGAEDTHDQSACTVMIAKTDGYEDGMVYYSFDDPDLPYRYPVTHAMLGTQFTIPLLHNKAPRFKANDEHAVIVEQFVNGIRTR